MADSRREDECHTHSQNSSEDSLLLDNGGPNPRVLPAVCIFKGISPSGKPHLHATSNETRFDHFVAGSLYCFNLQRLQKLEESTMELKLTQECLKRYVSAVNFSKKLETYVEREISRLDSMHRLELSKNRRLALEYYHKLCKDAKIHLSHWPNLECRTRLLTRSSGHALTVLRRIKQFKYEFLFLRRQILFWLSKIAMVGLRVLANSSFKQLSSTVDVQNFLLGIEEYNHLLSNDLQQLCSAAVYDVEDRDRCPFKKVPLSALTIVEILEMISIERSKLLAKLTHGHFVCEAKAVELQDFLSITRFSWTSEGHLSTQDLLKCTGSVSYGKLQSLIRKYGHKEEEFINQLLSTASVCVFLHHESEVRSRDSETCEDHLPQMNCQCTSAVSKCFICQLSDSSIKAITDGSDDCDFCDESGNRTSQLDDLVVSQDRRALFIESRPTKLRLQLCSIYRDDLWNRFGLKFYDCLQSLKWPYAMGASIGAACCWSTAVLMGITQHLDNLASKGPFSDVGVCSVRVVSRSLYLSSVLASLDGFHCLMLAVGQADKCKSATIIDGVPSMKTTSLMVQACSVFQHFFSTASHWEDLKPDQARSNSLLVCIEDVFDRFSAFLNYCIYWFTTKIKHFLAGWALSSFFGLSQYELGILMKSINTTLQLMEAMYCQLENVCSNGVIVKRHWDCMERKAGYLQVIEVESWENFKQKFIKMAGEFWLEMMPKGRFWKRSRNSGRHPSEPSSYVEHAIIQVLQPVIEGVTQLPAGLQNSILVQAVEIMMDTWSSHILKEEIKFSVIGAYQLQVDFNYVKLWLTSEASTLNTSVQSDLAILDVFRQLNEAVHLLTIQPKKKRKLIGVMENSFEPELESNSSTISDSSTGILSANSSYDGDLDQLNNQFIPNKEQWLNLRLRNGKPKIPLVIPACLKSVEQS